MNFLLNRSSTWRIDRAISHKSEFRARDTNVAFILGPAAFAGGRPDGVFGVTPDSAGASASAFGVVPAFGMFPHPVELPNVVGSLCVEEEDMK